MESSSIMEDRLVERYKTERVITSVPFLVVITLLVGIAAGVFATLGILRDMDRKVNKIMSDNFEIEQRMTSLKDDIKAVDCGGD